MRQINEEQIDTIRADCDNMEVHGLGVCWQAGKTANHPLSNRHIVVSKPGVTSLVPRSRLTTGTSGRTLKQVGLYANRGVFPVRE